MPERYNTIHGCERQRTFTRRSLLRGIAKGAVVGAAVRYGLRINSQQARAQTADSQSFRAPENYINLWFAHGPEVNIDHIRSNVRFIKGNQLDKLGYRCIALDDGWEADTRDENGDLQPDKIKFPSDPGTQNGIQKLAEELKAQDLKLATYTCVGNNTCAGYLGSYGNVAKDLQKFREWKVSRVKVDNCNHDPNDTRTDFERYKEFDDNFPTTYAGEDPMTFSICSWNKDNDIGTWIKNISHMPLMWRTSNDLILKDPEWDPKGIIVEDPWENVLRNYNASMSLGKFAAPGRYNDPDILAVGLGILDSDQEQSHFSLWAMIGPLGIGTDLSQIQQQSSLDILTNSQVLAVNQDTRMAQGVKYTNPQLNENPDAQTIYKYLSTGQNDYALLLFNSSNEPVTISWQLGSHKVGMQNLYTGKNLPGQYSGKFSQEVQPHGSLMYKIAI